MGTRNRSRSRSQKRSQHNSRRNLMKKKSMRAKSKKGSVKKGKSKGKMPLVDLKTLDGNTFYCVKCGCAQKGKDVKIKNYNNNRRAICGKCCECGTNVTRFISSK